MRTFLYILLACVLCSAAYKLGSSRATSRYKEMMHTYQVHVDSVGIVSIYKYGTFLGKTLIPIDSMLKIAK